MKGTTIRRVRQERFWATAVGSSVLGNKPIISHLLSPVCTQSSYCFHLAMARLSLPAGVARGRFLRSGCICIIHALPARFLALVLFVQPFLQRREIVQDGGGVHLALPADGFQRVRPGP